MTAWLPELVLSAAALIGLAFRRTLPPVLGESIFVAAASFAAAFASFKGYWPPLPSDDPWARAMRIAAALAAVWSASAWVVRTRPPPPSDASPPGASAAPFEAGALLCGTTAFVLALIHLAVAGFARIIYPNLADLLESDLPHLLRTHGLLDLLSLVVAAAFWCAARRDRLQPVVLMLLATLVVAWISLMIPGGILGSPTDALFPRPIWLPAWWTWTLNAQVGLAVLLVAAAWQRERTWRARRASAWPDHLDRLLEPYPAWPAFNEYFTILAAVVLLLGVYHIVRPQATYGPGGALQLVSTVGVAVACLHAAHRDWNANKAGLGLALVTVAAVTLPSFWLPHEPGIDYADRLPKQLNAALIGLDVTAFVFLWLTQVWKQQRTETGAAWTTAGRMIPLAHRTGFTIAALAVLVGYHMALWPMSPVAVGRDDAGSRWAAGVLGLLLLAGVTGWHSRRAHHVPLATLSVAALIAGLLFALVRWPATDARGWVMQYAPIVLAVASLIVLAVAEAVPASRAAAFAAPLWFVALLLLPGLALFHMYGRAPTEWVRPLAFTVLSLTFAVAATRERRRLLLLPSAALLAAAGWTTLVKYQLVQLD